MSLPGRTSLIVWGLLGLLAAPASGQIVRGRLLDRTGGSAVEGGIVTLLDSGGGEVSQVLSRASGWYALTAPGPGRYRLRAARIGYEDVVTASFELEAGQVLERDLTVMVRAIPLDGLTVKGKSRCELRPEQGVETQALWSAVRTALTATELTKLEGRLHYDVAEYTRELDPRTLEPEAPPTSRVRSGLAEHPFVSAPVAELMVHGFVRRGAERTSYYAPDAGVLLSDAFLEGHCLQVVLPERSDTAEAGRVGLAFRPITRRDVPDVRGTLWVDAATHELRRLEYRYTDLDVPDAAQLGGRVDFTGLPTGLWIVSRWYVRMPVTQAPRPRRRMSDPTPRQMRPHLAHILEQGGVVIGARDATGARLYASADPMAKEAVAAASRSGREARGAKTATAPADEACPDSLATRGDGRLQGVVRRRDTQEAVPRATVVVEWTGRRPTGADLKTFRSVPERATTHADSAGRYALCGLPVKTTLHVYAGAPGGAAVVAGLTLLGRRTVRRDLNIVPVAAELEGAARPARAGFVRGHVVDAATGDPLPNIEVMLSVGADSTGPSTGVMSASDGTFSFAEVAPGPHRLRTRSVGFVDGGWNVRVGPNGLSVRLELHGEPVRLEGLDVVARARAEMGGFYQRRAEKLGSFVDRAQIERLSPKRSSDLVRMVPGLRIICPGFSIRCVLRTSAVPALVGPDKGDCPVQYFLDGRLTPNFELDDLHPDEIEGIEVYTHAAEVPARFNIGVNSRCGVVVIWTRGP